MTTYQEERIFIIEEMVKGYQKCVGIDVLTEDKSQFDVVTQVDLAIEMYLIEQIKKRFPEDHILSEEMNHKAELQSRTWILDPIDGTVNFSRKIPIYGVQCAFYDQGEVVVSVIYLPLEGNIYSAEKSEGSFLNGQKLTVDKSVDLNHTIISFGDYTHQSEVLAKKQHQAIGQLYSKVAKIRMFGAACYDFSFVASSHTQACVVLTKNIWDIAPGLLIAKEAGAHIANLEGDGYQFNERGIIVASNLMLLKAIVEAFK